MELTEKKSSATQKMMYLMGYFITPNHASLVCSERAHKDTEYIHRGFDTFSCSTITGTLSWRSYNSPFDTSPSPMLNNPFDFVNSDTIAHPPPVAKVVFVVVLTL